jgi:hypothetical protein
MNASLHERQKAQQALPRRRPQQPPPAPPQHPILPPVPTITNRATALALIPDRFTHVRQPILAHGSRAALTTALYAFLFSLDEDRRDTIKTVMAALNAPMDDAEIADGTRSQTACREFARRIAIRLDTIFTNAERAEVTTPLPPPHAHSNLNPTHRRHLHARQHIRNQTLDRFLTPPLSPWQA